MKIVRFLALACTAALLFSCNKDDATGISVSTSELDFGYEGGTKELTVSAPELWRVSTNGVGWYTVTPSHGTEKTTLQVTVSQNPDHVNVRTAPLKIICGDQTRVVTINQEANQEAFFITPTEVSIGNLETDFTITVTSREGLEYDITVVDEWITEKSRSGQPATGETILFHAAENPDSMPRSGVVSVCTKDGSCIPVMVNQNAKSTPKVLAMRFTATWCGYCPYMDEVFHTLAGELENFEFVTFHASSGYPLYFKDSATLARAYQVGGFPTGIIGGWKTLNNYSSTAQTAASAKGMIQDFRSKFPSTAIISVQATVSGSKLSVTADILSTVTGSYSVVALVLESGIVQAQTYYPPSGGSTVVGDFVHDNVARKLLSQSILGDAVPLSAGEVKNLSWSVALDNSWNKDNLSALVWIYSDYGKLASQKAESSFPDTYILNAASAPAGK